MTRIKDLAKNYWLSAQLSNSPLVQKLLPPMFQLRDFGRIMRQPQFPVEILRGENNAGSLSAAYTGFGFVKDFLEVKLFNSTPSKEIFGVMNSSNPTAALSQVECDITIVEANEMLINRIPWPNALILPFRIRHSVAVGGDWADIKNRFHSRSRRKTGRIIEKYGYTLRVERYPAMFDYFYHQMYVPTIKTRHKALASIDSYSQVAAYAQRGYLLMVVKENKPVVGGVAAIAGDRVLASHSGLLHGDDRWLRERAKTSLNYFMIRWAHDNAFEWLDLGAAWPFMEDGIYQFKRQWGTFLDIRRHDGNRILMRINRDTPAVREFLMANKPIIIKDGRLLGLIALDREQQVSEAPNAGWEHAYLMSGMAGLLFKTPAELVGSENSPSTR